MREGALEAVRRDEGAVSISEVYYEKNISPVISFFSFYLPLFLSSLSPSYTEKAAVEENSGTNDKAKIVPESAVVDFIETHIPGKDRDDEGDGRNDPMPQAFPESGHLAFWVGLFFELVRPGHTAAKNKDKNQHKCQDANRFHFSSLLKIY